MTGVRSHLSRHVVGYVALFFALGGTAYAVGGQPASSPGADRGSPIAHISSDTRAYGRVNDGPVFTTDAASTLMALRLRPGAYFIVAKATVFNRAVEFECRLMAGGAVDRTRFGNFSEVNYETMALTLLHRSDSPFTARLQCPDGDPASGYALRNVKLTALRIQSLSIRTG
jgi:hypothetical protein